METTLIYARFADNILYELSRVDMFPYTAVITSDGASEEMNRLQTEDLELVEGFWVYGVYVSSLIHPPPGVNVVLGFQPALVNPNWIPEPDWWYGDAMQFRQEVWHFASAQHMVRVSLWVEGHLRLILINLLLVRAGLELNPGPFKPSETLSPFEYKSRGVVCIHDGEPATVAGKRANFFKEILVVTRRLPICCECHVFLRCGAGGYIHPAIASGSSPSAPPLPNAVKAFLGPHAETIELAASQLPLDRPTTFQEANQTVPAQQTPVATRAVVSTRGPVVDGPMPSGIPPIVAETLEVPVEVVRLDGRRISQEEVGDLTEFFHGRDGILTTSCIEYHGERRLVTNRNVKETCQDMVIQKLEFTTNPGLSYMCRFVTTFLVYVALASTVTWNWPFVWYIIFLWPRLITVKGFLFVGVYLGTLLFPSASIAQLLLSSFMFDRRRTISWCPHMISAVMEEFEAGTSAEVVRSNTRLKLNRLATLPVPDVAAVALKSGSEQVVYFLVPREPFFEDGATYATVAL
jgi:hypothetical protein